MPINRESLSGTKHHCKVAVVWESSDTYLLRTPKIVVASKLTLVHQFNPLDRSVVYVILFPDNSN